MVEDSTPNGDRCLLQKCKPITSYKMVEEPLKPQVLCPRLLYFLPKLIFSAFELFQKVLSTQVQNNPAYTINSSSHEIWLYQHHLQSDVTSFLRFCIAWKSSTSPFVPWAGFETQTPELNVKALVVVSLWWPQTRLPWGSDGAIRLCGYKG
jgi:hypothetical protein